MAIRRLAEIGSLEDLRKTPNPLLEGRALEIKKALLKALATPLPVNESKELVGLIAAYEAMKQGVLFHSKERGTPLDEEGVRDVHEFVSKHLSEVAVAGFHGNMKGICNQEEIELTTSAIKYLEQKREITPVKPANVVSLRPRRKRR